jgi:transcription antitermination factor NusG
LLQVKSLDSRLVHLEQAQDFDSRWYAAYTTPRHEKRLAEHFDVRRIEHFLPLYHVQRRWKDGSKVSLELPLFPNYIFVRIARRDRVRVLEVPGVLFIAGSGREPTPLPDDEIEALRRGLALWKIEPHYYLVVGEKACINAGPFAGMQGVLIRKKNNLRVVLTLPLIMQSVAVEVDAHDVVPVDPVRFPVALSSVATA